MKKFALEKLVEAAEVCKNSIPEEESLDKRELFSRAYAVITDIIEEVVASEDVKEEQSS
jgi:hypothetical protein